MQVYLNGEFIDVKDAKISVFDHGFLYGDGVFETIQYDAGKILNLEKHITRLHQSAETVLLQVPNIDFEKIILELIQRNQLLKARIRITLTRGDNHFHFLTCEHPTILVTASQYIEKRKDFYEGTKTCSIVMERPLPSIKTTQILPSILAQQKAARLGCDECFFINHTGEITEGSYSNIFAVKDGVLITPPLEDCLEGTIRSVIFELCEKEGIEIREEPILYKQLSKYQELFWTNAVVHVAPIKSLDDYEFEVGTMTRKIMNFVKERYLG